MCFLAGDEYAQKYVQENFRAVEASCLFCGGRVMHNIGAPYLEEYGCAGCDKFWDSGNLGKIFGKPRQCRPMVPY